MSLSSRARDLMLAASLFACESNDPKNPGITPPDESDTPTAIDTDRPDPDTDRPDTDTQETDGPVGPAGEIKHLQDMGLSLVQQALPSNLIPRDTTAPIGAAESWWNEVWVLLPGDEDEDKVLATGFVDTERCGTGMPIVDGASLATVGCLEEQVNYQGIIYIASGESQSGRKCVIFQGMAGRGPEVGVFCEDPATGNYIETDVLAGYRYKGVFFLSGLPQGADGLILRQNPAPAFDYLVSLHTFSIDAEGDINVVEEAVYRWIKAEDPPYTFRNFGDKLWILRGGSGEYLTEIMDLDVTGDVLSATPITDAFPADADIFRDLPPDASLQIGPFAPMGFLYGYNNIPGEDRTFREGVEVIGSGALEVGYYCAVGTTRQADPTFFVPNYPEVDGMVDRSWHFSLQGALKTEAYVTTDGGAYARKWDALNIPVITLDSDGNVVIPNMIIQTGGDDGGTTRGALDLLQGLPGTQTSILKRDMGLWDFFQAYKTGYYRNIDEIPVGQPTAGASFDPNQIHAGQFYNTHQLGLSTEGFSNDISFTNPRTFTITKSGYIFIGTEANIPYAGHEAVPGIMQWRRDREDACRVWTVSAKDDRLTEFPVEVLAADGSISTVRVVPHNGGKQLHHGEEMRGQFIACDGAVPTGTPTGWEINEVTYAQ